MSGRSILQQFRKVFLCLCGARVVRARHPEVSCWIDGSWKNLSHSFFWLRHFLRSEWLFQRFSRTKNTCKPWYSRHLGVSQGLLQRNLLTYHSHMIVRDTMVCLAHRSQHCGDMGDNFLTINPLCDAKVDFNAIFWLVNELSRYHHTPSCQHRWTIRVNTWNWCLLASGTAIVTIVGRGFKCGFSLNTQKILRIRFCYVWNTQMV